MVKEYKKISLDIIDILKSEKVDENQLEAKLDGRQDIIDKLYGETLDRFKRDYKKEEIYKLDEEIKAMLQQEIVIVRKDINGYKSNKQVNFAYANRKKTNLNIFSTKV